MKLKSQGLKTVTVGATCLLLGVVAVVAQDGAARREPSKQEAGAEAALVIKRRAIVLEDPRSYQVSMRLEPSRSVAVVAPADGIVRSVHVKPGDSLPSQGDVVRLDDTRAALLVRKAKAEVTARQLEQKLAEANGGSADTIALAEANLDAARAAYDVAELDHEKMVVRGPFAGVILQVHVVEGQFVRAGEAVAELADLTSMVAEVPVGHAQANPGDKVSVIVENATVPATVEAVFPPPPRFESLRPLVDSLSMARVRIDNSEGKFHPGQAVYVELIPTDPVTVVPAIAVSNAADGQRRVQVVRDYVVRDIAITPLAQINSERLYVSGEFSPHDEVIVSSTMELADGTQLRPWEKSVDAPEAIEREVKSQPRDTSPKPAGF